MKLSEVPQDGHGGFTMRLRELVANLPTAILIGDDAEITDITHDSRKVVQGSLFVCLKGLKVDGHDFVPEAIKRGAAAIVAEREVPTNGKPLVIVPDTREALAWLCHRFYGEPTKSLTLIGVTGTNGKTTTTHLIAHLLNAHNPDSAAVLGTVGVKWRGEWHELSQTTPDAPELVKWLARLRDKGARFVVMEVSSHALAQNEAMDACLTRRSSPTSLATIWTFTAILKVTLQRKRGCSPITLKLPLAMASHFTPSLMLTTHMGNGY